ncbi:MAG: NAD(P)H-binding protein [Polyangiales bacterium]
MSVAAPSILVLGATGTIGSRVVDSLARRDAPFVAGVRRPAELACATRPFDFLDASTWAPAFEGIEAFFFVSPLVDDQLALSLGVLEAAARSGVRHCVRLSSRATGWDRECPLRGWHRAIEDAIVASGLSWTMLRPCSFAQNFVTSHAALVRSRGVLAMPLGVGAIPFVDAVDLGEVAADCLLRPELHAGRTYVLTGPRAIGGAEAARILGEATGRSIRYLPVPHAEARANAIAAGTPAWLVDSGLRVYARAIGGEEAEVDPTLAMLLERPPTTFEEFVARERAAFLPEV